MKRQKNQPDVTAAQVDRLTAVVDNLAHHVRALSLILDEIRDELILTVRDERFRLPRFGSETALADCKESPSQESLEESKESEAPAAEAGRVASGQNTNPQHLFS